MPPVAVAGILANVTLAAAHPGYRLVVAGTQLANKGKDAGKISSKSTSHRNDIWEYSKL